MVSGTETSTYQKWTFTSVEFASAEDKVKVLKAWTTFLKHGCQFRHFTERLYKWLILNCSFIAHYDRGGFYAEYFERPECTIRFLSQFDRRQGCVSVEYGPMSGWVEGGNDVSRAYYDINNAMVDAAAEFIDGIVERCSSAERERDVATAHRLLAKHGEPVPE